MKKHLGRRTRSNRLNLERFKKAPELFTGDHCQNNRQIPHSHPIHIHSLSSELHKTSMKFCDRVSSEGTQPIKLYLIFTKCYIQKSLLVNNLGRFKRKSWASTSWKIYTRIHKFEARSKEWWSELFKFANSRTISTVQWLSHKNGQFLNHGL